MRARDDTNSHFDSAGVPIRYIVRGAGEAVVLVHSYTGCIEDAWIETRVLPRLAAHYRVIAFDARGHGLSGKPHDPRAYGREMGFDAVRLMDHLGIDKAHIAGYSMGAHIVAQLATLRPQRFLTMILGGACGRRNWTADDAARAEAEAAEMEQGLLRTQILRLWADKGPVPDEAAIRRMSAERLAGQDVLALAAVRRATHDQAITDAALAALEIPVLGVVGGADPYVEDFRAAVRIMRKMELVVIDGASHVSAPGRPEFIRAIETFLP